MKKQTGQQSTNKKGATMSTVSGTTTQATGMTTGDTGAAVYGGTNAQSRTMNNTKYEMGQSYGVSPTKGTATAGAGTAQTKSAATTSAASATKYEVGKAPTASTAKTTPATSQVSGTKFETGTIGETTAAKNVAQTTGATRYEIGKPAETKTGPTGSPSGTSPEKSGSR